MAWPWLHRGYKKACTKNIGYVQTSVHVLLSSQLFAVAFLMTAGKPAVMEVGTQYRKLKNEEKSPF